MSTIYRKYRPQSWEELAGQEHIKLTLEKELETSKMAHAYLFSGPRGSGKTTTARLLSKSLNCEKRAAGASASCGECSSCQEISSGHSIDVLEIDAASNTGVDNVRENIIDTARLLPTKSKYKIFIIDEVHMLSTSAFNALLKILEEPPAHVFFILATTEPYKIPATILSRCQRFDFKKVEIKKIIERLEMIAEKEDVKINKKVLDRVAHKSEGCLRDAEGLLGQLLALGEKNITEEEADLVLPRSDFHQIFNFLDFLFSKDLPGSITYINNLVEEGIDLLNFCENLIETVRTILLIKINPDLPSLKLEIEDEGLKSLKKISENAPLIELQHLLEALFKQKNNFKSSPVAQLPLELVIIEFCGVGDAGGKKDSSLTGAGKTEEKAVVEKMVVEKTVVEKPSAEKIVIEKISTEKISATDSPIAETNDAPVLLDIQEIKSKWQAFIDKVQNLNHSLPFILKMGEPLEIKNRSLKIGFRFALHRDKFNESKIKVLAEKAFDETFPGTKLRLEGQYHEGGSINEASAADGASELDKKEENSDNSVVNKLIEDFGGQILN